MIELFPQLFQEKMQFTAFVDPQLVTFLREQYALLKTAFKRFRATVKVGAIFTTRSFPHVLHTAFFGNMTTDSQA